MCGASSSRTTSPSIGELARAGHFVISVESRWASLRQNGQKRSEEIYKDGELISKKWWNSKGEEVETWKETEE